MFDTECLHTPFLPPPSSSSLNRSPMLKPSQHGLATVPEGTLVNLDDSYTPSSPRDHRAEQRENREQRDQPKRRPGFAKRPGDKEYRRQNGGNGTEDAGADSENDDDWEEEEWVPDVFLFEYGTVVIWGMTEKEEKTFLRMM